MTRSRCRGWIECLLVGYACPFARLPEGVGGFFLAQNFRRTVVYAVDAMFKRGIIALMDSSKAVHRRPAAPGSLRRNIMAFAIISGIAPRQGFPVFKAAIEAAGHKVVDSTSCGGVTVEVAGTRADAQSAVTAALEGVKSSSTYGFMIKYIGA